MAGITHSKVGPSSLHRLLACPGSYKLSETKPQGKSSSYAAQGTVAHALVEAQLSDRSIPAPAAGDVWTEEGHAILVDQEMLDGVGQMVAFCDNLKPGASQLWVEQQVDLSPLWGGSPPEAIFGTVDFAAYHPETDTLYVADLKYGRLPVHPQDNPQAQAYALGAAYALGRVPGTVVIVIIQPRGQDNNPVKIAAIAGLDLLIWADEVLKPGVDALFGPAPALNSGDHCRFCPAKIDCPALYALAKEAARTDFSHIPPDPINLNDKELAHILNNAEVIALWIESVRAEASGRIEKGKLVPGWKLVPKRASRKWDDEAEVICKADKLIGGGAFTRKVMSPTQIEKAFPTIYRDNFADNVTKQSSGTTLVADIDPRVAVIGSSGKDDFDAVEW